MAARAFYFETEALVNFFGGLDRICKVFGMANLWPAGIGLLLVIGTIFELSPSASGGWTERVIYSFKNLRDGAGPYSTLTFDRSGNIYGVTMAGGNRDDAYSNKLAINEAGYCYAGPPRPPYRILNSDAQTKAKEAAKRWRVLCERYPAKTSAAA